MKRIILILLILLLVAVLVWFRWPHPNREGYPDPVMTPGRTVMGMTAIQICQTQWGEDHRAVTSSMKKYVFEEYGYEQGDRDPRCPCEIDHDIPRALGGADVLENLWVQPYTGAWNAHLKDRLESATIRELRASCTEDHLKSLRGEFSDWHSAYIRRFGQPSD